MGKNSKPFVLVEQHTDTGEKHVVGRYKTQEEANDAKAGEVAANKGKKNVRFFVTRNVVP